MNRRSFLATAGTIGIVGVAGCVDGGGDGDGTPTPTETPAGTPTGTPTETPTGTPTETPTGTPADGGQAGGPVAMISDGNEYYFDPIGLFVESGTTVTWTNESGSHSSTAYHESLDPASVTRIPEGAEPWNSETLTEQGATFEHTFETAGTYDYFCIPHKTLGMVARIVVDEPGGPAEGSMPPDGEVPESATIVEQGSVSYGEFSG